jgi:hypothetical protein
VILIYMIIVVTIIFHREKIFRCIENYEIAENSFFFLVQKLQRILIRVFDFSLLICANNNIKCFERERENECIGVH